ncbi:MAG TPA: cytochrome b [Candidatus Desulfobacillus sp.]|nr:cytochrome b [Candidatus Desulfobacillus sp.]
MGLRNEAHRYGSAALWLHWAIVLLVIAALVFIELHGLYPKGSEAREAVKQIHFQLGMLVFLLMLARLAWRLGNPPPAIMPAPRPWEAFLSRLVHVFFYAALLALPLLGLASLQASGKPPAFLGLPLPALMTEDKALGKSLKGAHELIGNIVIWLIVLHVVAGFWHHIVRRDDTLLRMLPAWLARRLGR